MHNHGIRDHHQRHQQQLAPRPTSHSHTTHIHTHPSHPHHIPIPITSPSHPHRIPRMTLKQHEKSLMHFSHATHSAMHTGKSMPISKREKVAFQRWCISGVCRHFPIHLSCGRIMRDCLHLRVPVKMMCAGELLCVCWCGGGLFGVCVGGVGMCSGCVLGWGGGYGFACWGEKPSHAHITHTLTSHMHSYHTQTPHHIQYIRAWLAVCQS